jgi:hypothetical protein
VAAIVLSDHAGFILAACSKKLHRVDALVGEALAALLASGLPTISVAPPLFLKGILSSQF